MRKLSTTLLATWLSLLALSDEGWNHINGAVRKVSGQHGAVGTSAITTLFVVGILAFVLYIVIAAFWPSAQAANTTIQGNTATDSGTTTSKTFFNIGLFLIPVGVLVALFVILIKRVKE